MDQVQVTPLRIVSIVLLASSSTILHPLSATIAQLASFRIT
jgi:hypothetical protein